MLIRLEKMIIINPRKNKWYIVRDNKSMMRMLTMTLKIRIIVNTI